MSTPPILRQITRTSYFVYRSHISRSHEGFWFTQSEAEEYAKRYSTYINSDIPYIVVRHNYPERHCEIVAYYIKGEKVIYAE